MALRTDEVVVVLRTTQRAVVRPNALTVLVGMVRSSLTPFERELFEIVEQSPDISTPEIRDRTGKPLTVLGNTLSRLSGMDIMTSYRRSDPTGGLVRVWRVAWWWELANSEPI